MKTLDKLHSAGIAVETAAVGKESISQHSQWGWRHAIAILGSAGFMVNYMVIINLSVCIVSMVNNTALDILAVEQAGNESTLDMITFTSVCRADNVTSPQKDGPFVWDRSTTGILLSSFYYGYAFTQIPGGLLASRFGGKWVFGLGTLSASVLTLFTPLAAWAGIEWLIFVRVLEGLAEGVTFPACQAILASWVPPMERTKVPVLTISGCFIGTVITFMTSGVMADMNFLGGWPSVFYIYGKQFCYIYNAFLHLTISILKTGIIGCLWFIVWAVLVSSTPFDHRFISASEKDYIEKCLSAEVKASGKNGKAIKVKDLPWKAVITSLPVWAVFVSHFSYNWCNYTLLTSLPTYFKTVLGLDLKANGILSAVPYIALSLVQLGIGQIGDFLRTKCGLKTVHLRKLLDCSGHFFPGIGILCVGYIGCNKTAAIVLLTFTVGMAGLCGGGFFVNLFDLCPQYAGPIFGISNTLATIPGIVGPYVTALIIENEPTIERWQNVFYIATSIYFFSALFYLIFGQGSIQPWAEASEKGEKNSPKTDP
ncbi:Sialin [Trichinella pseudospiralis]|uniref:Sialin n=1 Tax=Trichinella pseudospiralis TaxID=6337 RepID=A0A0V1FER8_TRIPS|nr:Sialin [Trichinella pseudospiralis]